jgi:hypothetical protein
LIEGGQNKYRNRTVDVLFTSVAAHARTRAIGIVLRATSSVRSMKSPTKLRAACDQRRTRALVEADDLTPAPVEAPFDKVGMKICRHGGRRHECANLGRDTEDGCCGSRR